MAKHKQLWLKGSKGKLAGTTFYQTAGVTIQREINYDPSNPRTDKQMTQRTKLANLVNMYRAGKSFFPRAFENKKPLESDYNKFVSYNLTDSPIYLTKGEAAKGIFVPAAYQITQGSLPALNLAVANSGSIVFSGTGSSSFSANTTVAQFSAAFVASRAAAEYGDQLSLVCWKNANGVCHFSKIEIILSENDTRKVSDLATSHIEWAPSDGFSVDAEGDTAAAAAILSRTIAGKTLVSTENLVLEDGGTYEDHTGAIAQADAINSYGASKKVFLDNK